MPCCAYARAVFWKRSIGSRRTSAPLLMLRVLADLPISTIAEVMGKPETAVKALLRRAFASIERLRGPHEVADVDSSRGGGA